MHFGFSLTTDENPANCDYCALETTLASFNLRSSKPQLLWRALYANQQYKCANMGTLSQMKVKTSKGVLPPLFGEIPIDYHVLRHSVEMVGKPGITIYVMYAIQCVAELNKFMMQSQYVISCCIV